MADQPCINLKRNYETAEAEGTYDVPRHSEMLQDNQLEAPLSKRQRKKREKYLKLCSIRTIKRKEQKEKRKRMKAIKQENGIVTHVPTRKMKDSNCKLKVAIDMSFDSYMTDKDLRKALHQLQYCYATNRRAFNPLQLYITSFSGRGLVELCNKTGSNCSNWDVHIMQENYIDLFGKDNVMYLTSESPNVLMSLNTNVAYIIGGLVDHNSCKGLCYKLATEAGVPHAQLPISQYLDMKTCKVLTINHVFEILLRYTETENWETAFFTVIPKRKGVKRLKLDSEQETIRTEINNCTKLFEESTVMDITDDLKHLEKNSVALHMEAVS